MVSRLSMKLFEYEKHAVIGTDNDLRIAIESIIKEEEKKPYGKRDFDLIDEAVDALLSLQNVDIDKLEKHAEGSTDASIEKLAAKSCETRSRALKSRWIIPLAAAMCLIMMSTVFAGAMGIKVFELPKKVFLELSEKLSYTQEDQEFIVGSGVNEYSSIEEFVQNEDTDGLLLPYHLPSDFSVSEIKKTKLENQDEIRIYFVRDNHIQKMYVKTKASIGENVFNPNKKIGKYDVKYICYDNLFDATFFYNSTRYQFITSSYEALEIIIENLEEK